MHRMSPVPCKRCPFMQAIRSRDWPTRWYIPETASYICLATPQARQTHSQSAGSRTEKARRRERKSCFPPGVLPSATSLHRERHSLLSSLQNAKATAWPRKARARLPFLVCTFVTLLSLHWECILVLQTPPACDRFLTCILARFASLQSIRSRSHSLSLSNQHTRSLQTQSSAL